MPIKPRKLLFFANDVWKIVWLLKNKAVVDMHKKFFYSRSSTIPRIFTNYTLKMHNGRWWKKRFISQWAVGFKFGALIWNRKPAIYKAKQMRKKKNKLKKKLK